MLLTSTDSESQGPVRDQGEGGCSGHSGESVSPEEVIAQREHREEAGILSTTSRTGWELGRKEGGGREAEL